MRQKKIFLIACFLVGFSPAMALGKESKKTNLKTDVAEEMELELGAISSPSDTGKFEELKFEKSFVIEAKVERPQVQFPLLKEAPPVKMIPFEASFREELLSLPRENTFSVK